MRHVKVAALSMVIAIGLFWAVSNRPRTISFASWRDSADDAIPGIAVLVASVVIVSGDLAINAENNGAYNWIAGSVARRWLVTGLTAGFGIVASCLVHRGDRRGQLMLGMVVFAAALFFMFGIPDSRLHVNFVVHVMNGAYLILGVALGRLWVTGRRRTAALFAIASTGVPFAYAIYIHMVGSVRLGYLRFNISAGGLTALLIALAVHLWMRREPRPVIKSRNVRLQNSRISWMILIAAAVQFYANNYLLPGQGIVRTTYCLDAKNGSVLWDKGFLAPEEPLVALTSHATPTPASDGDRVYAYFGSTGLVAYSHGGQPEWQSGPLSIDSDYSVASSPVVDSDLVFLVCDHSGSSFVAAYNARTGIQRWRVDRDSDNSFGTPIITTFHGTKQLVIAAGSSVAGYDPTTGNELWSEPNDRTEAIPSPIVVGGLMFIGGDFRGEKLRAYRIPSADDVGSNQIQFETETPVVGYCSPVALGARIYTVTNLGVVHVLDANSGEIIWRHRLPGNFYASPIAAGGYVFLLSDDCTTTVIRDAELPEIVARNELDGTCMASPAIAGNQMFIRSLNEIWAIRTE